MKLLTFFRVIFWIACIIFAIDRGKFCFDNYLLDESYSNTEYREFLSPKAPYPALSICIKEPYIAEQLEEYNISNSQYENPEFQQYNNLTHLYSIPYDNVTLNANKSNFDLKTVLSFKNKDVSYYKFNLQAECKLVWRQVS